MVHQNSQQTLISYKVASIDHLPSSEAAGCVPMVQSVQVVCKLSSCLLKLILQGTFILLRLKVS